MVAKANSPSHKLLLAVEKIVTDSLSTPESRKIEARADPVLKHAVFRTNIRGNLTSTLSCDCSVNLLVLDTEMYRVVLVARFARVVGFESSCKCFWHLSILPVAVDGFILDFRLLSILCTCNSLLLNAIQHPRQHCTGQDFKQASNSRLPAR